MFILQNIQVQNHEELYLSGISCVRGWFGHSLLGHPISTNTFQLILCDESFCINFIQKFLFVNSFQFIIDHYSHLWFPDNGKSYLKMDTIFVSYFLIF